MSPENPSYPSDRPARPIVPRVPFALRLTFSYDRTRDNDGIRLARVERVRATVPGIATAPPQPGQSGAWFEVHDSAHKLLYYQPLHDPIPTSTEVFADESGQPALSRLPNKRMQGQFVLLVPDLPNAVTLVLHVSPVTPVIDSLTTTRDDSASSKRGRRQPTSPPPGHRPAQERARLAFEQLRAQANQRP